MAAGNQARLAHKFIGDGDRDNHIQSLRTTSRLPSRQQASHHLRSGQDDAEFMAEQLNEARKKRTTDSGAFTKIPGCFRTLLDVDGDGTIDQEEYALMEELENVVGEDFDGDGVIDEAETHLARIRAGRKLLAKVRMACNQYSLTQAVYRNSLIDKRAQCSDMALNSWIAHHKIARILSPRQSILRA